ncbi:MAG: hypothetical protein A2X36_17380 [Elusimicrobia bacterium GWA2_69_24]|nr:MAG: hypothetical protein A2X36_17380 [Elusimicrobia bacterium GWA2_69_24]HBL17911.1 hypothetical protein [Elusimicrobiota bacterium]
MRRSNLSELASTAWPWLLILAAAAALRFIGIGYGLPAVFNADEPHHVNVAVSFGSGTLDPGIFKYPTLWMYCLFAAFGALFAGWSGLGLLHSVREFGALFVWHPEVFYLTARLLAAALSLAGLYPLIRCGLALGRTNALWAAGLLAVSPTLIVSAHGAKPDSLMFFLAAWAWWLALRYVQEGRRRHLVLCGAAVGFCVATQYVAAPLALLVLSAWLARRLAGPERPRSADVLLGLGAVPAAFFIGSPFILLDWSSFLRDIRDVHAMASVGTPAPWTVGRNVLEFSGPWWAGGTLILAGAGLLAAAARPLAVLFLIPLAGQIAFLAAFPDGAWSRFLLGVFPAAALLAAAAVEHAAARARGAARPAFGWVLAALLAAVLLPGARQSWAVVAPLRRPDTRNIAAAWIAANLTPGTRILTFNEHASPPLRLSLDQVRRLIEQTREAGHPRRRYYELMAESHPGGGFEVFRILQDPAVLSAGPRHVAWSAAGRSVLDVSGGLQAVRGAGIALVVFTSYGSNEEGFRALRPFLDGLETQASLLREFAPEPGATVGPVIRIYRIRESKR